MRTFLTPSFVFLLRQWKSGELQLLAFALLISVITVTSLVFLTNHVKSIVENKTGELLGSDRAISSPAPLHSSLAKKANALGLQVTSTLNFLTMIVHQNELALTDVRAVGEHYPLRGTVRFSSELYGPDESTFKIPTRGTVWLEARLFPLLEVKVGDKVTIGSAEFTVERVLTSEPDRTFEGFNVAPWALINLQDVPATHVIQPGSRVNYKLLLAGKEENLKFFEDWAKPQLISNETWIDARHSRPMINLAIDRVEHYLGLVFLVNICFSGIAIFMVMRRFTERQFDTVALLRCFGATRGMILRRYAVSFILLGLIVGIIGIMIGFFVEKAIVEIFFKEFLPPISVLVFPKFGLPILIGLLTVFVLLFGFSFPPILRLLEITPLRVLRRDLPDPKPILKTTSFFAFISIAAFPMFQTGEYRLTGFIVLVSLGIALGLWGITFGLLKGLGKIKKKSGFSNMLLLIWIRNMGRRAKENAFQIIAFALVFGFIGALFLIRTELVKEWEAQIPKDAPNYFALNIPPVELSTFQNTVKAHGIKVADLYPVVLARILFVNQDPVFMTAGIDAKEDPKKRIFPRLLNISWTQHLPADNQIIAGKWINAIEQTHNDEPVISIEKGFAERLDIKLYDIITLQMGEKQIKAKVGSIRSVEWSSFKPNFYIIFTPGVLDDLPSTYMTSLFLPASDTGFIKTLVQKFPMINVIGTEMILTQIKSFLEVMLVTIQYLFLFSVITCFILLFSIILSTLDERQREAGLLRLLGINKNKLRWILLLEFLGLGFVAGLIGMISANGIVYWISQHYFNVVFQLNVASLLLGILAGMGLIGLGAWFGTRVIFQTPPWRIMT